MNDKNDKIISKLNSIEKELNYIKEHMVDKEEIMFKEEFEPYQRSFDKNNLVSLDDVKKELDL